MNRVIWLFLLSAAFHYAGPSFAVLLFPKVSVAGVTWLRIVGAAAVFAVWRRPWRQAIVLYRERAMIVVAFGVTLAAMNWCFYVAIARVPLATVAAIEFLGPIGLAAWGSRSAANVAALCITVVGVATISHVRLAGEPVGFAFAFSNCVLFTAYIVLGHRISRLRFKPAWKNVDGLAVAMLVAAAAITPIGLRSALPALGDPALLAAGFAVGVCSSVIPYVIDQSVMARLPRSSFSLLLALLPAFATLIGAVVLRQIPTVSELIGIALVGSGIALHRVEE